MEKRWSLVVVIVVTVVVVAAVGWVLFSGTGMGPSYRTGTMAGGGSQSASTSAAPTRTTVPANTTVPGANATGTVAANVAVPKVVAPGSTTGSSSFRSFNMTVTSSAFSPSEVIVYVGDTVSLSITAAGGSYDFTLPDYGMTVEIPQGTTKTIQLSPHATGDFLFYCSSCGGPESGPTGHLVVVAPKS